MARAILINIGTTKYQGSSMERHVQLLLSLIVMSSSLGQNNTRKLSEQCGSTVENEALFTYTGEAKAVLGMTKNRTVCWFDPYAGDVENIYTLKAKYRATGQEGECVMDTDLDNDLYFLHIQARKQIREVEMAGDENYKAECSFDRVAQSQPVSFLIVDSPKQDKVYLEHGYWLKFLDIDGQPITEFVRVGETVRLQIAMEGEEDKYGLTVENCEMQSEKDGEAVTLLKNGCGNGWPFQKDEGFVLDGPTAVSPAFVLNRISNGDKLKLACDIRKCLACGVNSCRLHPRTQEKKKRSLPISNSDSQTDSKNYPEILFDPVHVEASISVIGPEPEGTTLQDEPIQPPKPPRLDEDISDKMPQEEDQEVSPHIIPLAIIAGILALLCLVAVVAGLYLVFRIKRNHERQRRLVNEPQE